ncbi:hypothetical protein GQ42DRAFT_160057 [Ramicandelaber brevisporus]|nr:hypothetical protein GQ42DRAFT_160057 [Ramicandelaber brevisporus]
MMLPRLRMRITPDVYPLIGIITLALTGGITVSVHKLLTDKSLRNNDPTMRRSRE